jgi:hypothetical protein
MKEHIVSLDLNRKNIVKYLTDKTFIFYTFVQSGGKVEPGIASLSPLQKFAVLHGSDLCTTCPNLGTGKPRSH